MLRAEIMDTSLAKRYFDKGRQELGTVHSVFGSLINISTKDREIISLSHLRGFHMPLTIQIHEEPDFLRENGLLGSRVSFQDGVMEIRNHMSIDLKGAIRQIRMPKEITLTRDLTASFERARTMLLDHGKRGGCLSYYAAYEDGDLMERELTRRIGLLEDHMEFCRILGLGRGLTPSGDDFCLGLLCGAHYLRDENLGLMREGIRQAVDESGKNTTDVSLQMLISGLADHFNEPLMDLCEVILSGESHVECKKSMLKLLNIGSTSGSDMATGLLYAIEKAARKNIIGGEYV